MYIDGEAAASIDFLLLKGHGIGFTYSSENNVANWGTKRIAQNAAQGGLFNTYRVPFGKSIKITCTPTPSSSGTFWYIVRGVENFPIVLGDLQLPTNTRLKLYKNENVTLTPLEFITLANVTGIAGAVLQVFMQASSSDFNYLEACYRVKIDGATDYMWLSSGTEDFYLSAYYFNRGLYHDDDAGCTYKANPGAMSAYKFFEMDPILFTNSLVLVTRCGETQGDAQGCPNTYPPNNPKEDTKDFLNLKLANTVVTTYVWVYEYTLT